MKYIIEIEDEPFVRLSALFGEEGLYRAKGFNSLVFDQFGLDKLTPLDKALDEAYQNGYEVGSHEATTIEYQQGLNDAWEAAREIVWNTSFDDWKSVGVDIGEWDGDESEALNRYSVSEVIEILKKMGKQNPDEIKVGDEVRSNNAISDHTGVVLALSLEGNSAKVLENDGSMMWVAVNVLTKTGRHFNFLAELLKAMKEGAE